MLSDENRNGTQKTQVYMPSRGMNAQKSDLISDPDVGKTFKYRAQYPGVIQGSQEGIRAKLWGPRAHFGANISMKIACVGLSILQSNNNDTQSHVFVETCPLLIQTLLNRLLRSRYKSAHRIIVGYYGCFVYVNSTGQSSRSRRATENLFFFFESVR